MEGYISERDQRVMANIDAIYKLLQKSHNMLLNLALCLDAEVNLPKYGLN
jgi:hypothetical protein